VDERVGPGMHPGFGRHLDAPSGHRPVGVLDQIDLVKDGGKRCFDRLAGEVDERRLGGRHANTRGTLRLGSNRNVMRERMNDVTADRFGRVPEA
jgi:hypothetical protein